MKEFPHKTIKSNLKLIRVFRKEQSWHTFDAIKVDILSLLVIYEVSFNR